MSNVAKGLLWLLAAVIVTGLLAWAKSGLTVLVGVALLGASLAELEKSAPPSCPTCGRR